MSYCEKCKSTNVIEAENGNYCCNCGWDSTKKEYVKKQTNADRIRSMDDKELAGFLRGIDNGHDITYGDYFHTKDGDFIFSRDDINAKMIQWLQSEAE